jgi:hypothetical protein
MIEEGGYNFYRGEWIRAFSFGGSGPHENAFEMKNLRFEKTSFNSVICGSK